MILTFFQKIGGFFLSIFFIYSSFQASAQKHELGFGLGGSNYSGDIVKLVDVRNFRPAGQLYFRLNFSPAVCLKFATSLGVLTASDSKYNSPIADYRKASFSTLYNDVNVMVEYNFLDFAYTEKSNGEHFSPYITVGFGLLNYKSTISDPDYKVNTLAQPVIPLGGGFKYRTNAHWIFSFQFIANKTFTDSIDGIYNQKGSAKSITNTHDKDWYYYSGVSVGYVFWKVVCPR
ncbi:DUF6089 family protein [Cytophaga aurantiaca]|uniref:type IX secretion system protein PorG n=1 Tax=Cytophaga aurantiaca TaxID=29530 RepID=UPI00035EDD97|nr:DUF6089 family protein [Cytophaga aurantiaca]